MFALFVPYVYVCGVYRGMLWKAGLLYVLTKLVNAQYDLGMYVRFFVHAPKHIKKILELEPEKSFASIQTRLFMKHCAKIELEKAKGDEPKKLFTDMCVVKSYRNQIYDRIQSWKNFGVFLSNAFKSGPVKRD